MRRERIREGKRAFGPAAVLGALLAAVLVLAGLALAPAHLATAQELRFFRIGTGTTGGTYFPIGGLIANGISNPPGSRACERGGSCGVPGLIAVAQATSGSVENIQLMRAETLESALVQADIGYWARTGTGPYAKQPSMANLRAIASLYPEDVHIVVRADGPIRSIRDLKGKVVSVGEEGSGTLVDARLILEAHGVKERDVQARYLRPGPAADRLGEGAIDAFFLVAGNPAGAIADLAQRTPIRLLPVEAEAAAKLTRDVPFLTASTVPAGVYEGVEETPTVAVSAQWVVRAEVDEETVYGVTRALWHPNTKRLLSSGHPRGRQIDVSRATTGLGVPLHPGAARYYRELGLNVEAAEVPTTEAPSKPAR